MTDPFSISLGSLREGIVVDRPNRFVAVVRLDDRYEGDEGDEGGKDGGRTGDQATGEVLCHIADSGRLKELIYPGNRVLVRSVEARSSLARKTRYDLVLAEFDGPISVRPAAGTVNTAPTWVSVDTRYPTRLFGQVLRAQLVPEFARYDVVRAEYPFHKLEERSRVLPEPGSSAKSSDQPDTARKTPRSRLDFYLEGPDVPPALVEVKSVTLCVDGVGLFPDAPTERGARHLGELQKAVSMGYRAYAVFIAQREDIRSVSPNAATDPRFAEALKQAKKHGVRLLAYRCLLSSERIVFDPAVMPVVV